MERWTDQGQLRRAQVGEIGDRRVGRVDAAVAVGVDRSQLPVEVTAVGDAFLGLTVRVRRAKAFDQCALGEEQALLSGGEILDQDVLQVARRTIAPRQAALWSLSPIVAAS